MRSLCGSPCTPRWGEGSWGGFLEHGVGGEHQTPRSALVWSQHCAGAMLCGSVWQGWDGAPTLAPQLTGLCSPQVKSVNLSDGEVLSIRGVDGDALVVLANQTLLVEGQVIRSPTNTISVYFRTFQDDVVGTFQLHYQGGCVPEVGGRTVGCAPTDQPRSCFTPCPCPEHRLGWVEVWCPGVEGSMCPDVPNPSAGCASHTRLAPFLSPCSSSSCTHSHCQSIFYLEEL